MGWENVNITIDEAVYGGGYSVAQGSVLANNTTVLKLTDKYNLDYAIIANGNGDDLTVGVDSAPIADGDSFQMILATY